MNTQIDQKYYTYVFVRKDITLQQQIVQASHAALQAGLKFTNPSDEPNSLIVIGIRNKEQLLKAMSFLEKNNIAYESFSEPSWDYGLTALLHSLYQKQTEKFSNHFSYGEIHNECL